jgi:hypothetical protein
MTHSARVLDRRLVRPGRFWVRIVLGAIVVAALGAAIGPTASAQSANGGDAANVPTSARGRERASPLDDPLKPGEPLDLSFDDLKFDIEKGADFKPSMLTDEIKKLDGQTIRIRGFILPAFKQTGIKRFVLVRDNQECCFGPKAALYDCVKVQMAAGETVEYTVRPVAVVGTMQLKEYLGPDKKVWAIFHLNDTRME